jgi:energy-coupling factor transporter ATP-binding protein EcfA2
MIDDIEFVAGPDVDAPSLRVGQAAVTVLVGPNNAGKSQALRDIEALIGGAQPKAVVRSITTTVRLSMEETVREIEGLGGTLNGMMLNSPPGLMPMVNGTAVRAVDPMNEGRRHRDLLNVYSSARTLRLDGTTRLQLTDRHPGGDMRERPRNIPRLLVDSTSLREQLRELVFGALGLYLIVTPTDDVGSFELRLSPRPPADDDEELGYSARARTFRAQSRPIGDFSDGVRAYVGILAAQVAPHFACVLIDEPEAFLHPSWTRRLGAHLAQLAARERRSVIAATHSADFLLGCIDAGSSVNVVRLTYSTAGKATARVLPATELQTLVRKPLLRSTNVLTALFHSGAVVCEGESDRPFYQEVHHRLTDSGEGDSHTAFLSVNGKGSSPIVLAPLRRLGVAAAAVVDFDATKDADGRFARLLEAAGMPEPSRRGIGQARGELWSAIEKAGLKDRAKKEGLAALASLSSDLQRGAAELIEQVATYGVFVVPVGEVEGWLRTLGVPGEKTSWTAAMLERLGSDPSSAEYVRPTDGDVWKFLRQVARWINDPARKGTHA